MKAAFSSTASSTTPIRFTRNCSSFPYPKAGTKNPSVRVGTIGASGGQPQWMQIPGGPRENYLFRMDWADDRSVAVAQLNRRQNMVTVYLGETTSGAAKVVFRDQDDAWVFVPEGEGAARETQSFDWVKGRQSFLWLSERDGWRRAYSVSLSGGGTGGGDSGGKRRSGSCRRRRGGPLDLLHRIARECHRAVSFPVAHRPAGDSGANHARGGSAALISTTFRPDCRWAFHTYSTFDRVPATDLVSLPEEKSVPHAGGERAVAIQCGRIARSAGGVFPTSVGFGSDG
jgi:dipeptidyl-peptidase-4